MDFMSKKQQNQHGLKQYKLLLFAAITICCICVLFVSLKIVKASGQLSPDIGEDSQPSISFVNEADLQARQSHIQDAEAEMPSCAKEAEAEKVNINLASKEELLVLKGIGEVKAEAIITYRFENGSFQSIYEIVKVSGIGEKTFENIKDYIIV